MSVVSRLPGDSLTLTLMQKCILWRIVKPDRVRRLNVVCIFWPCSELRLSDSDQARNLKSKSLKLRLVQSTA